MRLAVAARAAAPSGGHRRARRRAGTVIAGRELRGDGVARAACASRPVARLDWCRPRPRELRRTTARRPPPPDRRRTRCAALPRHACRASGPPHAPAPPTTVCFARRCWPCPGPAGSSWADGGVAAPWPGADPDRLAASWRAASPQARAAAAAGSDAVRASSWRARCRSTVTLAMGGCASRAEPGSALRAETRCCSVPTRAGSYLLAEVRDPTRQRADARDAQAERAGPPPSSPAAPASPAAIFIASAAPGLLQEAPASGMDSGLLPVAQRRVAGRTPTATASSCACRARRCPNELALDVHDAAAAAPATHMDASPAGGVLRHAGADSASSH